MEYRQLGNAGVRVSVVGLGANRFGSLDVPQVEVDKIIGAALDSGVNFIDTANVYNDGRSEETLGHALKGSLDKVVIATKFNFPRKTSANNWGASRYQMMQRWSRACGGCRPIISISITAIAGTTRRRSKKLCVGWMI
jgi:Predicted oxidoreductases (related to aryl-alcohol dehydrogenases)